jgi:hypothetical protein
VARAAGCAVTDNAEARRVIRLGFQHYRIELVEQLRERGDKRWYATVWRGGFYSSGRGQWVDGACCTIDTWRPDRDLCAATAAEAVSKVRRMARDWVRWQLGLPRASGLS